MSAQHSEPPPSEGSATAIPDGVHRPDRLDIWRIGDQSWPLEIAHAAAIDAHWATATAANPKYFDGRVHVATVSAMVDGCLTAEIVACAFKSYLYWRENPAADRSSRDVFAAAIVVTADGCVMLGRQATGNLNAGLAYPPSGLIDVRDIAGDGRVDLAASAARELEEETGLTSVDVRPTGDVIVTVLAPYLAVGIVFACALAADDLAQRVGRFIASDADAELTEVIFVRSAADAASIPSPPFVRPLLDRIFAA